MRAVDVANGIPVPAGARVAIYNGLLVVVSPNEPPFYVDMQTKQRRQVELGVEAEKLEWFR